LPKREKDEKTSAVKLAGEKLQNRLSCKQDTLRLYADGKNLLSTVLPRRSVGYDRGVG
jgi:hypothetical protein